MRGNRKIIKRIALGIQIETSSPLCVSSGLDAITDNDLQRDFNGNVFVSGTSLAGAMRAYLEDASDLFGDTEKMDGKMSSLICSDLIFKKSELKMAERDGVGLENKVAKQGAKYNIEIIEMGAKGTFRLLLLIREGDKEEQWMDALKKIFFGIQQGEIRFGAKKNRGFGNFTIKNIYYKQYMKKNIYEWINYGYKEEALFTDKNKEVLSNWMIDTESKFIKLQIPLELTGGISIRKYSTSGDVDFEHIKSKEKPVVPGTSWAGAIRQRVAEIAEQLFDKKRATVIINKWFGYVENKRDDGSEATASQSLVVIKESIIEGGTDLEVTRNKVNRFDNSTIDGALYTELGHFEGKSVLEILVRKQSSDDNRAFIGLLLLAIQDLQKGYLSVGGQTSVGRGIFKGELNDIIITDNSGELSKHQYLEYIKELKTYIGRKRNGN